MACVKEHYVVAGAEIDTRIAHIQPAAGGIIIAELACPPKSDHRVERSGELTDAEQFTQTGFDVLPGSTSVSFLKRDCGCFGEPRANSAKE